MPMSIWVLIQDYIDQTGATEASIQRRAGLNKGTFTAWRARGVPALPAREHLIGLADALHVDYETALSAILHDCSYLPEQAARDFGVQEARRRLERVERGRALMRATLDDYEDDLAAAREDERTRVDDDGDRFAFGHILRMDDPDDIRQGMDRLVDDATANLDGHIERRDQLAARRSRDGGPSAGQRKRKTLDDLGEDTQDPGVDA